MNCLWIIIKRFNILGARKHEKTKKELEQEIAGLPFEDYLQKLSERAVFFCPTT
jgi:hypothetical protein